MGSSRNDQRRQLNFSMDSGIVLIEDIFRDLDCARWPRFHPRTRRRCLNIPLGKEEVLALALGAMRDARDEDAITLLTALAEAEPDFAEGQYLFAAQCAQMGDMVSAEAGFRHVLQLAPGMAMARFQLGQLLALDARPGEAIEALRPLAADADSALGAYAAAVSNWAEGALAPAVAFLDKGLSHPRQAPELRDDMARLRGVLLSSLEHAPSDRSSELAAGLPGASLYLSNYRRYN